MLLVILMGLATPVWWSMVYPGMYPADDADDAAAVAGVDVDAVPDPPTASPCP